MLLRHLGGIGLHLAWWQRLAAAEDEYPRRAPAFTHTEAADWINSPPLTMEDLRGEVLLPDFWALDC